MYSNVQFQRYYFGSNDHICAGLYSQRIFLDFIFELFKVTDGIDKPLLIVTPG